MTLLTGFLDNMIIPAGVISLCGFLFFWIRLVTVEKVLRSKYFLLLFVGNGQTEFVYAITGLEKPSSGKVTMNGVDITKFSIRERSKHGVSHIPEDRHKHGLVLDYTLENNMVLQRYWDKQFQTAGFIKSGHIRLL